MNQFEPERNPCEVLARHLNDQQPRVRGWLHRSLSGSVSDLAQEVFLRAWRKRTTFRGWTVGQLVEWLRTITQRTVVDHFRKHAALKNRARLQAISSSSEDSEDYVADPRQRPPADSAMAGELREVMQRVLTPIEYKVVFDYYFRHLTQQQIANNLGVGHATVIWHLRTATRRIRLAYEIDCHATRPQ